MRLRRRDFFVGAEHGGFLSDVGMRKHGFLKGPNAGTTEDEGRAEQ